MVGAVHVQQDALTLAHLVPHELEVASRPSSQDGYERIVAPDLVRDPSSEKRLDEAGPRDPSPSTMSAIRRACRTLAASGSSIPASAVTSNVGRPRNKVDTAAFSVRSQRSCSSSIALNRYPWR